MPLPKEEIQRRFTYHQPDARKTKLHDSLREIVKFTADAINDLPDGDDPRGSREKSAALTHLEEALFWANAHIARNL